ncbi:carboxypeptidase regulatory-like domain-containing protein [bacterium]|nr:carboxypeptidase regulatory-like domain-containing protein [bacterium]
MQYRKYFAGALIILCLFACDNKESITNPKTKTVDIHGTVTFPGDRMIDHQELTVGLGDREASVSEDCTFKIKGNKGAAGLIFACDENNRPILMSILPNAQKGSTVSLNARSTALAMTFLCPMVCVSDPDDAQEVLSVLENLDELEDLEALLQQILASNLPDPFQGDSEIDSLLMKTVNAYIETYLPVAEKYYPVSSRQMKKMTRTREEEIVIAPGNIVSGHQITHSSGNSFKISNWSGRWAYCVMPGQSFYLFPNGSLLDVLKLDSPWAPSEREFSLTIEANKPPVEVNVFGFGWNDDPDNLWDNLSVEEKSYAYFGGFSTILLEFAPQVISVVCNTSTTIGRSKLAKNKIFKALNYIFSNTMAMDRYYEFIQKNDPYGLSWFTTKIIIDLIVTDDEFRETIIEIMNITITDGALKRLAAAAHVFGQILITGDALTSLAKTTLSFFTTRFKTTFQISKEDVSFGLVEGYILDESSGRPIEGATVELKGDEDNPMNPVHTYITLGDGSFRFENIMVGEKTLTASKPGYEVKTVSVTVEDDKTSFINIKLSQTSGHVSGQVLNKIFIDHNVTPALFKEEVHLDITEIGGAGNTESYWAYNGTYDADLAPGRYRITATHEDYQSASVEVNIPAEEDVSAPDIIMNPDGFMRGNIYINMNADEDDSYEIQRAFDASGSSVGCTKEATDYACPSDNQRTFINIAGIVMLPDGSIDNICVNTVSNISMGTFTLGNDDLVGCPGYQVVAGAWFNTSINRCVPPDGDMPEDMDFKVSENEACNCGITNFGSLYLDEVGLELGEIIQGKIVVDLPGSANCQCGGPTRPPECAKASIDVEFRMLIGSGEYEFLGK